MQQIHTEDKETQTDDAITNYEKQTQSEKTPKETPKGKQEKITSSPRPGPALKPATLEMMKEERKREEKDRITQQQKEERRQQYQKDKQEKELKEKE